MRGRKRKTWVLHIINALSKMLHSYCRYIVDLELNLITNDDDLQRCECCIWNDPASSWQWEAFCQKERMLFPFSHAEPGRSLQVPALQNHWDQAQSSSTTSSQSPIKQSNICNKINCRVTEYLILWKVIGSIWWLGLPAVWLHVPVSSSCHWCTRQLLSLL